MACQRKHPCCRPGRRNQPRAPNPLNKAIPSLPPCPMTSVGKVLSTLGGSFLPLAPVLPASTAPPLDTIPPSPTAHQHKRPRCRPGCHNLPRAPNPPDKAIPSLPPCLMTYVGAVLSSTLGGSFLPSTSVLPVSLAQPLEAVPSSPTARRRKWPCRHPGCCPPCRPGQPT